jgi:hypothetical protein
LTMRFPIYTRSRFGWPHLRPGEGLVEGDAFLTRVCGWVLILQGLIAGGTKVNCWEGRGVAPKTALVSPKSISVVLRSALDLDFASRYPYP